MAAAVRLEGALPGAEAGMEMVAVVRGVAALMELETAAAAAIGAEAAKLQPH